MDDTPASRRLAGGITEDVVTALAGLDGIHVISRTSVTASAGNGRTVASIGRDLGAQYVLEGSVRRSGDHVRISVRLARAGRDRHVWAQTFDRQVDDLFTIEAGVADEVATALRRLLAPEPEPG
jgi:adenylate cyclase